MNRNTPMDKIYRQAAKRLLEMMKNGGYGPQEAIGLVLAAVQIVYPDIQIDEGGGDVVLISGNETAH